MRRMFKSKIHRATVTHADLDYEGSLSIDRDLMVAANIIPYEEVHVWNVTCGTRLVTYAIEAPAGSGIICTNGAAAHLTKMGDLIIIATFHDLDEVPALYAPVVVRVDETNHIVGLASETAGGLSNPSMIRRVIAATSFRTAPHPTQSGYARSTGGQVRRRSGSGCLTRPSRAPRDKDTTLTRFP